MGLIFSLVREVKEHQAKTTNECLLAIHPSLPSPSFILLLEGSFVQVGRYYNYLSKFKLCLSSPFPQQSPHSCISGLMVQTHVMLSVTERMDKESAYSDPRSRLRVI